MTYRVVYTPNMHRAVSEHVDYLRSQRVSDELIEEWFGRLFDLVDSLKEWPERFPVDPAAEVAFDRPAPRKVTFGQLIIQYRVEERPNQVVVLGMIHAARRRGT